MPADAQTNRRVDVWVGLSILVFFSLMLNGYWSAGGDSDVYLDMARNIATGKGYLFNHQPVSQVTPLWPIVLAGAMKISSSFLFLKMVSMLFMLAGLMVWYRILLRLTVPRIAAGAVMVAALLAPLETLTYRFYTEGLFLLVAAGTVLVALQISAGKPLIWRLPALLLLCAAVIGTRWAGILFWPLIAGALVNGRSLRDVIRDRRALLLVALTLAATLAAFFALRQMLRVTPDQLDLRYDTQLAIHYDYINEEDTLDSFAKRILAGWQWIGGLIWQPVMVAGKLAKDGVMLATLGVIITGLAFIPGMFRKGQWLYLGAVAYAVALYLNWPRPVSRYILPAAPLYLLIMYQAAIEFADRRPNWQRFLRPMVTVGIVSVVVSNVLFAAVEIHVARARDYYGTFEAGLNQSFIDAIHHAREQDVKDAEIAINPLNVSLKNSGQFRNRYMRAAVVLAERGVRMLPRELAGYRNDLGEIIAHPHDGEPIRQWLAKEGVKYYLYRPPASTVWHFDVRGVRWLSAEPAGAPDAMDWVLYEVRDDQLHRVKPPKTNGWPRKMPGVTGIFDF